MRLGDARESQRGFNGIGPEFTPRTEQEIDQVRVRLDCRRSLMFFALDPSSHVKTCLVCWRHGGTSDKGARIFS